MGLMSSTPERNAGGGWSLWSDWLLTVLNFAVATRPSKGGGAFGPAQRLRASDGERDEIVHVLGQHFSDGRLDQDELDQRMGKAMAAKTRGDLMGLLHDLPSVSSGPPIPQLSMWKKIQGTALVVIVLLAATLPLLLVVHLVILAVVVAVAIAATGVRTSAVLSERRWHRHLHDHGTPHWHGRGGSIIVESRWQRLLGGPPPR